MLPLLLLSQVLMVLVRLLAGAEFPGWAYFLSSFSSALLWMPLSRCCCCCRNCSRWSAMTTAHDLSAARRAMTEFRAPAVELARFRLRVVVAVVFVLVCLGLLAARATSCRCSATTTS